MEWIEAFNEETMEMMLPNPSQLCVCLYKDNIFIATYIKGNPWTNDKESSIVGWYKKNDLKKSVDVDYWIPLPELPK